LNSTDSKKNKTALYENLFVKPKTPSQFEVQGAIINDMIYASEGMTWKEQAQAYSSMATRYGNELTDLKRRGAELAWWLDGMDSE
jgi:hypothetical protein